MTRPASAGTHDDTMSTAGYERVFAVLERCDGSRSLAQFQERLLEALPLAYQCKYVTFFQGETLDSAFADPEPLFPDGARERRMLTEYQHRWRSSDVYATRAASDRLGSQGVAVLRRLDGLPAESLSYVRDFLAPLELTGSAAMLLRLPTGAVGLVGLFDADQRRFQGEDGRGLQLLARHLSSITQLLPAADADVLKGVSGSQRDVALLVGDGLSNAAIGARLHLAEDTVKKYVSRVLTATGCRSRTELAVRLMRSSR